MDPKPVYDLDAVEFQLQTSWSVGHPLFEAWPTGATVTYAIAADDPVRTDDNWVAMDAVQVAAAQKAFALWNELIGSIQLVAVDDPGAADITFSYSGSVPASASGRTPTELGPQNPGPAEYPSFPITRADVQINYSEGSNADAGLTLNSFGFSTFLHEIGHALGLSHPGNYNASDKGAPTYTKDAVYAQDSQQYTVMSYFGSESAAGWDVNADGGYYAATPMLDDIATIQSKYGVNWNTRDTDTTYGYHSNAGWDFFDFTKDTHPVFTIWDGGGDDTIDVSQYAGKQTIDLMPGTYSSVLGYVDDIAVAYDMAQVGDPTDTDLIENAIGGDGDDTIDGNGADNLLVGNGGNDTLYGYGGIDTLDGGAGDDILDGGGSGEHTITTPGGTVFGADILTGSGGSDVFVYSTGYRLTTITDFNVHADQLDLTKTALHDWQTLLGTATQVGSDTVLEFAKGSHGVNDDLTLQGVSLDDFQNMDPVSVAFSPDTTPVFGGFDILPNPSSDFTTQYAYVAPLAGGGFAALRLSVAEVGSGALFVYRYDASGVAIDRVQVNTVPWDGGSMAMIGLGSGRVMVVWDTATGCNGGGAGIRGRVLDANGNPLGSDFIVNTGRSSGTGAIDWHVSLTASAGGGAVLTWAANTSEAVPESQKLHIFRNGIDASGGVTGSDEDLGVATTFDYTRVYAIPDVLSYYATQSEHGDPYTTWHAWYQIGGVAVQIDNNDFIPDENGADSPPFNATELTDGRVLFQYSTGFTFGFSERVTGEKIVILDPVTGGFTKPGTDRDDVLKGGSAGDQLYGLGGNDTLQGNGGGDLLDGGDGRDTADYAPSLQPVTIDLRIAGPQGGDGDGKGDTLVSIENITGSAYDDVLRGNAGANVIDGSYGNDTIEGDGGDDMLLGGAGNDLITLLGDTTDGSVSEAHGGAGNDTIYVDGSDGLIYGEAGDDRLIIRGESDMAYGGDGNDTLLVTGGGTNTLDGGDGDDALSGGSGHDTLYGGVGDDFYSASGGTDLVYDSGGNDTLVYRGAIGNFVIRDDAPNDIVTITDTRDGAPEGNTTATGIDSFVFGGTVMSLAELQAYAAALGTSGRIADGYVTGATVFGDSNLDGMLDPGEASGTSDATGHFAVGDASATLVAVGGTDIATRLPETLPLSAPAGAQIITPLTTLLTGLSGAASVPRVLAAFGIGAGYDLLASDPIAGAKAGEADAVRAFVAGTQVMTTLAAGTAFLGALFGGDATGFFAGMLNGLALVLVDAVPVDLADAATIRTALNYGSGFATIDPDVLDRVSAAIAGMNAAADARAGLDGDALLVAESAVGRTAQGAFVPALFAGGVDTTKLDAVLAQYSGAALDDAIAANVPLLGNVDGAPCYCPGTRIATPRGEVAVEDLRVGDVVLVAARESKCGVHQDRVHAAVRWIGRRSYAGRFIADNHLMLPVTIRAGALADGVPHADLMVSPGHAMWVDGQLVPAWRLVNGASITQDDAVDAVTYIHVELHRHALLLANGAPAESFLDEAGLRGAFPNGAEFHARHPDAAPLAPMQARLEDGFALAGIQARLAGRAGLAGRMGVTGRAGVAPVVGGLRGYVDQAGPLRVCGWAQDVADPEAAVTLEISVDGAPVLCVPANLYRADLRAAGLGSGCHAFEVTLPDEWMGRVTVRRVADGAGLACTEDAAQRAA